MYNVLLDRNGEAKLGVGDMSIHGAIGHDLFREERSRIVDGSAMVVIDGNLSEDNVHYLLKMCADGEEKIELCSL